VPTLVNRAYSTLQFWDGRAGSLEEQVKAPIANPSEMTRDPTPELAYRRVVERLKAVPDYVARFEAAFGTADFTIDHVARAVATFERTIVSGNSPYDRYVAGDAAALTPEQVEGLDVFFKKAACDRCHLADRFVDDLFYDHDERALQGRRVVLDRATGREQPQIQGFDFTDGSFQNTGVGTDRPDPDPGRAAVTGSESDRGAFKTPTLREVEHTGPYMHDGSLATLEDVVEFYDRGGIPNPHLSPNLRPLNLSAAEKRALVAFLKALSGEGWRSLRPLAERPH
jgi:cytochrome c peroxidase